MDAGAIGEKIFMGVVNVLFTSVATPVVWGITPVVMPIFALSAAIYKAKEIHFDKKENKFNALHPGPGPLTAADAAVLKSIQNSGKGAFQGYDDNFYRMKMHGALMVPFWGPYYFVDNLDD